MALATADTYSSILKENVFALTTSGSGPLRVPISIASIAEISSGVSVKLKMSKFSTMRFGWTDFWNNRESVLDVPAKHKLCRDEEFGAVDTGPPNSFTDRTLALIGCGGVDEPIADSDRTSDGTRDEVQGVARQCTEPKGRHSGAVVQSNRGVLLLIVSAL